MPRTPLTDSQIWLILNTPDVVSNDVLASAIGATEAAVRGARWRLKHQGWTFKVSYGVCRVCARLFTRQGHKAGRRQYHDACRPAVLKQLQPFHGKARWERMTGEERQALLDWAHQHTLTRQSQTIGLDHNRMRRWTDAEDEAILAPNAPPDHELALELGRTLSANRGRRLALRKRGRFVPLAEASDASA